MGNKVDYFLKCISYTILVFFTYFSITMESMGYTLFSIIGFIIMLKFDYDIIVKGNTSKKVWGNWGKTLAIVAITYIPINFVCLMLADFLGRTFTTVTIGEAGLYVFVGVTVLLGIIIFVEKTVVLVAGLAFSIKVNKENE